VQYVGHLFIGPPPQFTDNAFRFTAPDKPVTAIHDYCHNHSGILLSNMTHHDDGGEAT
jgi:hypothetical protein